MRKVCYTSPYPSVTPSLWSELRNLYEIWLLGTFVKCQVHHALIRLIPGNSMWNLWCILSGTGTVFNQYLDCFLPVIIPSVVYTNPLPLVMWQTDPSILHDAMTSVLCWDSAFDLALGWTQNKAVLQYSVKCICPHVMFKIGHQRLSLHMKVWICRYFSK